ncbi:MAG: hypothetical protein U5L04_08125 [Trueperaceae bacterium]|nr:hypothetical protein [Trueperaceae bacterium]
MARALLPLMMMILSVACCPPQAAPVPDTPTETAFVANVIRVEADRLLLRPTQNGADVWGFLDDHTRIVSHDGVRLAVTSLETAHPLWLRGVPSERGVEVAEIRRLER